MRMIYAEPLIEAIEARADNQEDLPPLTAGDFIKMINDQPTAEQDPAYWEPIRRGEPGYSAGDFRCTNCGKPNKCFSLTDYCPNCGRRTLKKKGTKSR